MFTQLDGMIFTSRIKYGFRSLAGSRTDLKNLLSGADLCLFYQIFKKLATVSGPELIELIGYRIKNLPEFILFHLFDIIL